MICGFGVFCADVEVCCGVGLRRAPIQLVELLVFFAPVEVEAVHFALLLQLV